MWTNAGSRPAALPWCPKSVYRTPAAIAMIAAIAAIAPMSLAQEAPPEIVPLKKELRRKKDLGPRALALLRMTASGKATLMPIMIEIDGKFYDASAYKADPVPMALESGTVYEGEKTGAPLGLFTVYGALHSLAANAEIPWLATGTWLASGAEAPKKAMKAEKAPKGLENTDAPPRLTKGDTTATTTPPATKPDAKPDASASTAPSTPSSTTAPSGPNPAPTPSVPTSTGTPVPTPGTPKVEGKKDEKAPAPTEAPAVNTQSSSSSDDSNRPRLRRGKPTGPLPDYDVPGYGKPGSAKNSTASGGSDSGAKAAASAAMEPVELVPAISDAAGPELRSFAYEWDKGAEDERLKQMTSLAKDQVRAYIDARAKGQIPAKPAPRTTPRKSAVKPVDPVLENVKMRTFDLWGSNQPVMVLSADAHLPQPVSASTNDLPSAPLQYKVLLITRTDIYGNLHKLYSGVTDRFHLDVTPQLELIDAVDADGDGQGELLFHKTTDSATGYAIYRVTADTLWKMFDSVKAE
jgi:hypothetical protein